MPLVMENWSKYGLKGYTIVQLSNGLGASGLDDSHPHGVQAILHWADMDSVSKAVSSEEAKTVFGDIPNFSDQAPTFSAGAVVGTG